jgi:hypothetical protein
MKKLFILSTLAAFVFVPSSAIAQNSGMDKKKKNKNGSSCASEKNLKLPLNLMIR